MRITFNVTGKDNEILHILATDLIMCNDEKALVSASIFTASKIWSISLFIMLIENSNVATMMFITNASNTSRIVKLYITFEVLGNNSSLNGKLALRLKNYSGQENTQHIAKTFSDNFLSQWNYMNDNNSTFNSQLFTKFE